MSAGGSGLLKNFLNRHPFLLFRDTARTNLMPEGANVKTFGGYATSIFVAGYATGGLTFCSFADCSGRGKALAISV